MKIILLFPSIHYVLKAEKFAKQAGMPVELIPVPKEISSDCGMALEVEAEELNSLIAFLTERGLKPTSLVRRKEQGFEILEDWTLS
ncbi:DUF3343 domain-containing protein [Thermodesulfatator atlanticus]|uniref:DUF3343 domain-containing protein n=1 Tax=Thermodesulfatator atlanticus TaxID=501497 RepID=UPI0003B6D907|nr:DUF3343 domain-containing protein [Thermodesulfatator atlanticus]